MPNFFILTSVVLTLGIAACATPPAPTVVSPTPTLALRSATPVPAISAPTQTVPRPTATIASNSRTDTIEFETTLSSDDTVAVVDDVEHLQGVINAQSSGQAIQVTYDPTLVNLEQITTTIENYGIRLKKK